MSEDAVARVVVGVVMAAAGVAVIWTARAAASGRLRRNDFAGIRTPVTMASDEAWLTAHRRAERPTVWAGVVAVASGLLSVPPLPIEVLMVGVIVACAVMLALVLYGVRVGTRAVRRLGDRENRSPGPTA